jgi:hypothetical protein
MAIPKSGYKCKTEDIWNPLFMRDCCTYSAASKSLRFSLFYLFQVAVGTSLYTQTIWRRRVGWWWIGKNVEGSGRSLIEALLSFAWRDWGKLPKPCGRIADVTAEIRSEHCRNTSLQSCRCTNRLGEVLSFMTRFYYIQPIYRARFKGGSDRGGRPEASTKQKYNPQIVLRHLLL